MPKVQRGQEVPRALRWWRRRSYGRSQGLRMTPVARRLQARAHRASGRRASPANARNHAHRKVAAHPARPKTGAWQRPGPGHVTRQGVAAYAQLQSQAPVSAPSRGGLKLRRSRFQSHCKNLDKNHHKN